MIELKKKTKTTHYVDYSDLKKFLSEKLGKTVEIIGLGNDTSHSIIVDIPNPDDTMEKWNAEDRAEFVGSGLIDFQLTGFNPAMTYAAINGWIEPGNYVVIVSW